MGDYCRLVSFILVASGATKSWTFFLRFCQKLHAEVFFARLNKKRHTNKKRIIPLPKPHQFTLSSYSGHGWDRSLLPYKGWKMEKKSYLIDGSIFRYTVKERQLSHWLCFGARISILLCFRTDTEWKGNWWCYFIWVLYFASRKRPAQKDETYLPRAEAMGWQKSITQLSQWRCLTQISSNSKTWFSRGVVCWLSSRQRRSAK